MRKSFIFLLVIFSIGLLLEGYRWLFRDLPNPEELEDYFIIPSVRITDRYGRLLYEVLPKNGGRHFIVSLDSIPIYLQQATIATEDLNFYHNPGVDFQGVLRAAWINLRGGDTLAGGSTITQQVVRNFLMDSSEKYQRTLQRKLRESLIAWQIDRLYSKNEILTLYLNHIYYGGLSYGVEAAAQTFFAKPVSELSLAECALLAGLPQSPARYNPYTHPSSAKERQLVVLELMQKGEFITYEQRILAAKEPLRYAEIPYPLEAPHFTMMVRSELDYLVENPEYQYIDHQGGIIVRTTLNLDWQQKAESLIKKQIDKLKKSENGIGHNVNNAALVSLDVNSGEILALVGSPDYFNQSISGAINMAISPRQPGSAIKPIIYAAAMDPSRPNPWTPATMILDVRTAFTTHDGFAYVPENYDGKEHGPVSLREALASSLNIPAVITLEQIGMQKLFSLANSLGITTFDDPSTFDLSIALGGGSVSLVELTSAYAAFANGGFRLDPHMILDIHNSHGDPIYQSPAPPKTRVLDSRVAWLISDILSDNDARVIGFRQNSVLRLDRPAAVKTGTTTNFHDNWTIGYTPEIVVGVWVGNTDYRPMREVTGVTGAAPIWHQFMRSVLSGKAITQFEQPPGLIQKEICIPSGFLPSGKCPYRRWEWFIQGTEPSDDAPTAAQYPDINLIITSPVLGAKYRLDSGFSKYAQRILISASCNQDITRVILLLDGLPLASFSKPPYEYWWSLESGNHSILAEAITNDGKLIQSKPINFSIY